MELESLVSSLECPVCLEIPKAKPIYQCANGHLICCHCKPSLAIQICPTCEIEYKDQPIRNIIAEKIWEIGAILPCRFDSCNFKATKVVLMVR
jgi:E3 ubiquitin-protein ligase SIAH1